VAVSGHYDEKFFDGPMAPEGMSKRLRAVTQRTRMAFSWKIRTNGEARKIVDTATARDYSDSFVIYRDQYPCRGATAAALHKRSRTPGTLDPQITGGLFREQSKPWKSMVEGCVDELLHAAETTIAQVPNIPADAQTVEGVLRFIINPRSLLLMYGSCVTSIMRPTKSCQSRTIQGQ